MNEEGMKRPISPALMAGVVAAVIAVVAFIGYKTFASNNSEAISQADAVKMNSSGNSTGSAASTYSTQIQNRPKNGFGGGGSSYQNSSQSYSQQMQQGRH